MDWIELKECPRAYVAVAAWQRLIGLAWLDEMPDGSGLLIPWCSSIHTIGMRFALDVDFLGADGRALRSERGVGPRRMLRCAGAVAVLERPATSKRQRAARGGCRAPRARGPR